MCRSPFSQPSSEAATDTINIAGSNQKSSRWPSSARGEVGSIPLPASMGSLSSPPNEAAECGVCVLTASQSRCHSPPNTPQLWTQHSQPTYHCCSLIQTALLRANFRKSSEITFSLLTKFSWQRP